MLEFRHGSVLINVILEKAMSLDIQFTDKPLGHEIRGVDLQDLDDSTFREIDLAYKEYGVVVIRGQQLSPKAQLAFSRRFGALDRFVFDRFNMKDYPEIFIVSNVIEDERPIGMEDAGRYWHSDMWYVQKPPRGSFLYALEVPHDGSRPLGDTCFASTQYAYETLPQHLKEKIENLSAVFSSKKYGEYVGHTEEKANNNIYLKDVVAAREKIKNNVITHPLVRIHPLTGKKCLHVVQGVISEVIGLNHAESDELIDSLVSHVIRPEAVYRHSWRVGDIVMWDNYSALHQANGDFKLPQRRLMHRTTLSAPLAA
ncbi:MAG: taurine dioxygenase [Herminiimonas sp.]|nr:taurine dioxygenase [Herminiimonas sp.]